MNFMNKYLEKIAAIKKNKKAEVQPGIKKPKKTAKPFVSLKAKIESSTKSRKKHVK
jgi:hypothetical protein